MRYLCLEQLDGEALGAVDEAAGKDLTRRSIEYDKDLERRGVYVTSDALQGPEKARIVRARNGKVSTTDGPYAETKEHLGGFILIDASGMDEAVEIAANIPVGQYGTIEVRPISAMNAD